MTDVTGLASMRSPDQLVAAGFGEDLGTFAGARLQAARRLDWRFLLPDPRLGDVACLTPVDETLLTSLQFFSRSVHLVEPGTEAQGGYDLVVTGTADRRRVASACQFVKPGGFLYVEAPGFSARLWSRLRGMNWPAVASSHPGALLKVAAEQELTGAQIYWHWPDFANTSQIIPLDDDPALRLALTRIGKVRHNRIGAASVLLLIRSGLLARLVPCFSLVARKPGGDIES